MDIARSAGHVLLNEKDAGAHGGHSPATRAKISSATLSTIKNSPEIISQWSIAKCGSGSVTVTEFNNNKDPKFLFKEKFDTKLVTNPETDEETAVTICLSNRRAADFSDVSRQTINNWLNLKKEGKFTSKKTK